MLHKNVKNTITQIKEELSKKATQYDTPKQGIMMEVPAYTPKNKQQKQSILASSGVHVHTETPTPRESKKEIVMIEEQPLDFQSLFTILKPLGFSHDYPIKAVLAVYASTFLEAKDPIWLMLVGNPSSNKTTLVDLLKEAEHIYRLDSMTGNPFSSGQKESDKPKDLLPLLHGKCFIIKEYGTLFGRSDELVKQLISDLVAIYDGEYSKHSPMRGTVTYNSYFSHIGCVTPMALQSRQKYMSSVGARFLFLRIEPLSHEERQSNFGKIWETSGVDHKKNASKAIAHYCAQLKARAKNNANITFSTDAITYIQHLAELTACARGIIITESTSFQNEGGENISHYEVVDKQIEEPFRALKQFKKLAISLAIVNDKKEVGTEELEILKKIALSSMPIRRADSLKAFENERSFTAKHASEILGRNYKTVKRNFDELVALGVLQSDKNNNDLARVYSLQEKFKDILLPDPLRLVQSILGDECRYL